MAALFDETIAPDRAGLDQEALERLSASIRADIDQERIYGASVIVARGGVIGLMENIGTVGPDRKAAPDDIYLLMSMSKSLVAALVLRAIDHGRFTIDTRVADILPSFGVGGKQRTTVRHLFTHTSGTHEGMSPPPPLTLADQGDLDKYVAAISALPATHAPGGSVGYTALSTYALLAKLVTATDPAGRSFQDIAREDLFEPLGMSDSSYGLAKDAPRRVPVSFAPKNQSPVTAATANMLNSWDENAVLPGGNGFGTGQDVFKFAEAMRRSEEGSYRYISPSLMRYATQNHTGDMINHSVDSACEETGLPPLIANFSLMGGYARGKGHFLNACGHTASDRAFAAVGGGSTMWMVDPERKLTFVFLSAGFILSLAHIQRLQRLSDLALAACVD